MQHPGPETPQRTISDEIARLYKQRLGRGPIRVSTSIGATTVTIVLHGVQTPYEELMVEAGGRALVEEGRNRIHRHLAPETLEIVRQATGRVPTGQVGGFDIQLGMSIVTVLLEPPADAAPES